MARECFLHVTSIALLANYSTILATRNLYPIFVRYFRLHVAGCRLHVAGYMLQGQSLKLVYNLGREKAILLQDFYLPFVKKSLKLKSPHAT